MKPQQKAIDSVPPAVEQALVAPGTAPTLGSWVAGRYLLQRQLGAGGMAVVWLAYDRVLDAFCALKLLHAVHAAQKDVRARFLREASMTARIRSRHVVKVVDHGQWHGVPFIAMEYLDGDDLGSLIACKGRLDPIRTHRIIAQVARGLAEAHASGVVHRDIKPANIVLLADHQSRGATTEYAKLVDFGLAKQAHPVASVTQNGIFLGTPDYSSPEQLRGRAVDARSDLWSLAVVTFECLTGRLPFADDSFADMCGHILYEPPPSIRRHAPWLPEAVETWWARAVAQDPDQRFQSAIELADALGAVLGITAPHRAAARAVARRSRGRRPSFWVVSLLCFSLVLAVFALGEANAHPSQGASRPRPGDSHGAALQMKQSLRSIISHGTACAARGLTQAANRLASFATQ